MLTSSKWADVYHRLIHAYRMTFSAANEGSFRYENAETFHTLIQEVGDDDEELIKFCRKGFEESHYAIVREASLRVLLLRDDMNFLQGVKKNVLVKGDQNIDDYTLQLLFISASSVEELFFYYSHTENIQLKNAILAALLRHDTHVGRSLFFEMVARNDRFLDIALYQIARWNDHELLRHISEYPIDLLPTQEFWPSADPRLLATFLLALQGNRMSFDLLLRAAEKSDFQAAFACTFLAWLSSPEVVDYVKPLLKSDEVDTRIIALGAAAATRSGALVEPLLDLLLNEKRLGHSYYGSVEEILRVLEIICGPAPFQFEYIDDYPSKVTSATLDRGYEYFARVSKDISPEIRYHQGLPLTLSHLADDLTLGYSGRYVSAAYNLQSITGKDLGYNVDGDIIANYHSISLWRRVVSAFQFYPGSWR